MKIVKLIYRYDDVEEMKEHIDLMRHKGFIVISRFTFYDYWQVEYKDYNQYLRA